MAQIRDLQNDLAEENRIRISAENDFKRVVNQVNDLEMQKNKRVEQYDEIIDQGASRNRKLQEELDKTKAKFDIMQEDLERTKRHLVAAQGESFQLRQAAAKQQAEAQAQEPSGLTVEKVIADAKEALGAAEEVKKAMIDQYWVDMGKKDEEIAELQRQLQGNIAQKQDSTNLASVEKQAMVDLYWKDMEEKDAQIAKLQGQFQELMTLKQDADTKAEGYRAECDALHTQLDNRTMEWQQASQAATQNERHLKEEERRRIEAETNRDNLLKQVNTLKTELEQQKQIVGTHTEKENIKKGAGPSKPNKSSQTTSNIQNNSSQLEKNLREALAASEEKDKRIAELEMAANTIHLGSGMSKQKLDITNPHSNTTQNKSGLGEQMQRLQAKLNQARATIETQKDEILRLKYQRTKFSCAAAEMGEQAATSREQVEVLEATFASQLDTIKKLEVRNTSLQLHMNDMYEKYVRGPQAEEENMPKAPGHRGQSSQAATPPPAQQFFRVLIVLIFLGLYGLGDVFS